MEFKEFIDFINKKSEDIIEDGDNPIIFFENLKKLGKFIKKKITALENIVVDEVEKNPGEYPQFFVSNRETLQYKMNEVYLKKYNILKDFERKIKTATKMKEKGDFFVDSDGVIIDPVDIKFTKILTFRNNLKNYEKN